MPLGTGVGGFFAGALSVFRGLRRLAEDRALRRLAVVPVLVTAVLYLLAACAALLYVKDLLAMIWARPSSGAGLLIWNLLLPVVLLCLFAVMALLFTTVADLIGGPFYDRMAIRVLREHQISADDPGFLRGTAVSVAGGLAYLAAAATCGLLSLLPGVGPVFFVAGAVVAALGFATSALGPTLGSTGVPFRTRLTYFRSSFSSMVGIGAVIGAALLVLPLLGLVFIPAGVIGAAELYARGLEKR